MDDLQLNKGVVSELQSNRHINIDIIDRTRGPDVGAYQPPRPQLWEMLWL